MNQIVFFRFISFECDSQFYFNDLILVIDSDLNIFIFLFRIRAMHCRLMFYGETAVSAPNVRRFIVGDVRKFLGCPNDLNVIQVESIRHAHSNAIFLKNSAGATFSILVLNNVNNQTQELTKIRYNGRFLVIDKR